MEDKTILIPGNAAIDMDKVKETIKSKATAPEAELLKIGKDRAHRSPKYRTPNSNLRLSNKYNRFEPLPHPVPVGDWFKYWMDKLEISLSEAGRSISVDSYQLTRILSGYTISPSLYIVLGFCQAFDIPTSELSNIIVRAPTQRGKGPHAKNRKRAEKALLE